MLTRIRRVGTGAHGEVYEARWGGRRVAAKVLDAQASLGEAEALELAGRLHRLGCDAFVPSLDVTIEHGRWVLVLEWVEGTDLRALVGAETLCSRGIRGILAQCADALRHAWSSPVDGGPLRLVHRDLKPANLLLQPDGHLRIADLGLASRCIRPGFEAAGTPSFTAPERWIGEEGPSSDAYALGGIAYSLCTGRPPPVAGPHRSAHDRRLRAMRADLIEHGTDPALIGTVLGLLDWDPEHRPTYDDLVLLGAHRSALQAWLRPSLWSRMSELWASAIRPLRGEATCTPL